MAKKDGINIPVGVDTRPLQTGMEQAAAIVQTGGEQMAAAVTTTSQKSSNGLKSLQQAYRATYKDAQILAQQQGVNSQAFQEAATAAAKYKDELEDVQDAIKAASPEQRWKLVGSAIQGATDIAQGFVGVLSLIGIESNSAEKAIQAMMSLSAISGAISGVFQLADSYKALTASIAASTVASNTLWASMLKPLKYAAGILGAIVATISGAGKGSALSEGFNFKVEDLKFKADKEPIVKTDKIKEAKKEIVNLGDAFSMVQIQVKKTQLAIGSLTDSAPQQIAYLVESTGQSFNKIGVFLDELGAKIGGWADMASMAMGDLFYSAGKALAGGEEFGKDVLSIIGGIAGQLGSALIAIGVPLLSNPLTFGMGVATMASGAALKLIAGGLAQSSSGGTTSAGGGIGQANYSGSFMPNFQGTQFLMLDGKVRGQDLVIATSNTNRDNRRVR